MSIKWEEGPSLPFEKTNSRASYFVDIQALNFVGLDAQIPKRYRLIAVVEGLCQFWKTGTESHSLLVPPGFTQAMAAVVARQPYGGTPLIDHFAQIIPRQGLAGTPYEKEVVIGCIGPGGQQLLDGIHGSTAESRSQALSGLPLPDFKVLNGLDVTWKS
jgi:hypothetical protein